MNGRSSLDPNRDPKDITAGLASTLTATLNCHPIRAHPKL